MKQPNKLTAILAMGGILMSLMSGPVLGMNDEMGGKGEKTSRYVPLRELPGPLDPSVVVIERLTRPPIADPDAGPDGCSTRVRNWCFSDSLGNLCFYFGRGLCGAACISIIILFVHFVYYDNG